MKYNKNKLIEKNIYNYIKQRNTRNKPNIFSIRAGIKYSVKFLERFLNTFRSVFDLLQTGKQGWDVSVQANIDPISWSNRRSFICSSFILHSFTEPVFHTRRQCQLRRRQGARWSRLDPEASVPYCQGRL